MPDIEYLTVETLDNHVMFYSDIDADRALALIRELRSLDSKLRAESISRGVRSEVPIWLHINSGGGELFTSFALADQIQMIASPVYSIVEGIALSGASLLSMACKRRYITPNSFMMIHQLRAIVEGTNDEIKNAALLNEKLMERLYLFYETHSNLDSDAVREMLKQDTWLGAEDALAHGIVDEILTKES